LYDADCLIKSEQRPCTHIASCKITTLHHEAWNDSMERAALVSEAMLACAKLAKVLGGFRDYVIVKMELDATGFD
jgi:hypothetical protein